MLTVKLSSKNQIVLPKEARSRRLNGLRRERGGTNRAGLLARRFQGEGVENEAIASDSVTTSTTCTRP